MLGPTSNNVQQCSVLLANNVASVYKGLNVSTIEYRLTQSLGNLWFLVTPTFRFSKSSVFDF